MMKTSIVLFSALLATFSIGARANDCQGLTEQSQINSCLDAELKSQTASINSIYNSYRSKLDPNQAEQLKTAQLSWIKFRDQECKFESSAVIKGSMYQSVLDQCLISQTKTRITQLDSLQKCESGVSPSCI